MKINSFIVSLLLAGAILVPARAQVKVAVHETAPGAVLPPELYGQFSEHLGRCIYDGLWVGPESPIPNQDGYRTDVLEALKALKVPVLRWPGGCFADEYHWQDGIGPRELRPKMVNSNWGGTVEDNSFGTHEFLNLCELIGCEPYISANVGSGTVEEMAKWVEYMTAEKGSMAELRAKNGRARPWKVKYLGVGNESWGCGGDMTAEYYSDVYKRYALYAREYDGNRLYKVACGANGGDFPWTKTLMERSRRQMNGLSVHFYSVINWDDKGSATQFSKGDYYDILGKAVEVDDLLKGHIAIMDALDPEGRVGLLLDEWGTWYNVEPGTNPGHLFQQNTMRDAVMAALSLNIFNKWVPRLKMANIAQVVNVLQAMVLTKGADMVLTPTYHVFRMYTVHQGATALPADYAAPEILSPSGRPLPSLSVTASKAADGSLHVSLVNPNADEPLPVTVNFDAFKPSSVKGEVLTGRIDAYNDFGTAPAVSPASLRGARISGSSVSLTLPATSVVVLELK